jgi:hypothetical protein
VRWCQTSCLEAGQAERWWQTSSLERGGDGVRRLAWDGIIAVSSNSDVRRFVLNFYL